MTSDRIEEKIRALQTSAKRYSGGLVVVANPLLSTGEDLRVGTYPPGPNARWAAVPRASIEEMDEIGWTVAHNEAVPIVVLTFKKELSSIRALVKRALIRVRDGDLLSATAQIVNETGHPIRVEEFRMWPEDLAMVWAPGGEVAPGGRTKESTTWNYYDDTNVGVLVIFRDLATGNLFRGDATPELGNGQNNPMVVKVGKKLRVEHGNGDTEVDWQPA